MTCVGVVRAVELEQDGRCHVGESETAARGAILRADREMLQAARIEGLRCAEALAAEQAEEAWRLSEEAEVLRVASRHRGVRWLRQCTTRMRAERRAAHSRLCTAREAQELKGMAAAENDSRLLERRAITTRSVQHKESVKRCLLMQMEQAHWEAVHINASFGLGDAEYLRRQREISEKRSREQLLCDALHAREVLRREENVERSALAHDGVDSQLDALQRQSDARIIESKVVQACAAARADTAAEELAERLYLTQVGFRRKSLVLAHDEQQGRAALSCHQAALHTLMHREAGFAQQYRDLQREQAEMRSQLLWEFQEVHASLVLQIPWL